MKILLAAIVLLLGGCGALTKFVKPAPVAENCDRMCRVPCTVDSAIQYRGPASSNESEFDALTQQVVIPLRGELDRCETEHRQACVQCLDRLKKAGLTE